MLLRWVWCPEVARLVVLAPMGPTRWGGESEEWVVHLNYDMDDERALDDDSVLEDLRRGLGIGDHPLDVHLITRWTIGGVVADRFKVGRTFIVGDAAHRHPPTGGLGLTDRDARRPQPVLEAGAGPPRGRRPRLARHLRARAAPGGCP